MNLNDWIFVIGVLGVCLGMQILLFKDMFEQLKKLEINEERCITVEDEENKEDK